MSDSGPSATLAGGTIPPKLPLVSTVEREAPGMGWRVSVPRSGLTSTLSIAALAGDAGRQPTFPFSSHHLGSWGGAGILGNMDAMLENIFTLYSLSKRTNNSPAPDGRWSTPALRP